MPVEACSGLWRSEDMVVLSLQMQREVAHDAILKLGEIGMFQFHDLNEGFSPFQRDFVQEVRHCDDMERKIRFLRDEIDKSGVMGIPQDGAKGETMFSLEQKVEEVYNEVVEFKKQYQALIVEYNFTREHLEIVNHEFSRVTGDGLKVLTGVVPKERLSTFERMIHWVTRGNSILRTDDIEIPFYNVNANEPIYKAVFVIYFSAARLGEKLVKLCEVNGATLYPHAETEERLQQMRGSLLQQFETVTATLQQSSQRQRQVLLSIASSCHEWHRAVVTERAVFSTMNLIKFTGSTAVARGWAPARALDDIRAALVEADHLSGAQVATVIERVASKEKPPTYFRTNKVTASFQSIVDSYGIARYKEVNPGVFTIITFPYLFGIMFGDIGHGLILTLAAAYLVIKEKSFEGRQLNEIFGMIFGGRYLLLFMGLFAVYMGLLYNEMFGFSVEIFASSYRWPELLPDAKSNVIYPSYPDGSPNVKPDSPVIFGVDSAWEGTENKLEFYNSIKMKCSVIVGVVQMLAGVVLSLFNHRYFNDTIKVRYRFIPEIVFLSCTFGYMCLLIIIKWLTTWENTNDAPSLLETMTDFFLSPGSVRLPLFTGQAVLQVVLLLVAAACVPCLLCIEPYMQKKKYSDTMRYRSLHRSFDDEMEEVEEEFQLGEVIIHQIIHTIEYVLGCVSNTASYLRLWALSLAHSQLSEVFWNFSFLLAVELDGGSGVVIFFGFAVWMAATLGVLLGMESLSAFLHALRLHWVEFNNKFYAADGYPFEPFDLAEILTVIR